MQTTPEFVIQVQTMWDDEAAVVGFLSQRVAGDPVPFGSRFMQVFTARSDAQMAQRTWAKWFASRGMQLVIVGITLTLTETK